MRFQYYLFDLDGTLTRSEEGITKSVAHALEELGEPVPDLSVLRRFIGPPLKDSFMKITGLSDEAAEEAIRIYRERYSTVGWMENLVYPGIPAMLRSLKRHGAYIALCSSKPEEFCRKILTYFALMPLFDAVSAPGFRAQSSSKAQLVKDALPDGVAPDLVCMVGDRLFDMEGAKANGITAVGALYGYGDKEELTSAGADAVFEDAASMEKWFLDGDDREPGVFFSLEGSDGCGKTTQLTLLKTYLNKLGYEMVYTREPGGSPIAEKIRDVVLSVENMGMSDACEALLYAASRAEHAAKVLMPAVAEGKMVLSDRYVDSSIAYQGFGRELSEGFIRQINSWATDHIMPCATFYLDMDPDAALRRRKAASEPDRMESEKNDFFRKVYKAYDELRKQAPWRFYSVNADQTPEAVHQDVQNAVREALERLNRSIVKAAGKAREGV